MIACITGSWNGNWSVKIFLDCELPMLPDSEKCKKMVARSGDFGMDQYVS